MSLKLKVLLILIIVLLLLYVFKSVKNNKISVKYALIWIIADIAVIFCILLVEPLLKVSNFIGIKTVSNMLFFLGFIFLLILCFNQSTQISIQNKKIIKLTQELGILKNQIDKDKKQNEKKVNK